MTRTSTGRQRHSWREGAIVLGGFAVAALYTAGALVLDTGLDIAGPLWLAAVLWTVPSSLALALRSGIREGDWSAFCDYRLPDNRRENFDWDTRSGEYAWMRVAEEHERLMRGS